MPDVEGVDEWAVYSPYVENMEPVAILKSGTTVLGGDEDRDGEVAKAQDVV